MKKVVIWLAKVFKVDITREVIKTNKIIIYKAINNRIEEDVYIDGDLTVTGKLDVSGDINCLKVK